MNLNTLTHSHAGTQNKHTHVLFLLCQLRDLGCACGPCSQKDDGKLVRKCHTAGFVNLSCLFLCLWWLYVIYLPFLTHFGLSSGLVHPDYADVSKLWIMLPCCFNGLRLDWCFIVQPSLSLQSLGNVWPQERHPWKSLERSSLDNMEPGHFFVSISLCHSCL